MSERRSAEILKFPDPALHRLEKLHKALLSRTFVEVTCRDGSFHHGWPEVVTERVVTLRYTVYEDSLLQHREVNISPESIRSVHVSDQGSVELFKKS